jgi:hypothetical protein
MDAPSSFGRSVATVAIVLIVAASLCSLEGDNPQQDLCPLLLAVATALAVPLVLPRGGEARAWLLLPHPPLVPARHRPAPI